MDPPLHPPPITTQQLGPTPTPYPDSVDSSPRSRATDFDESSLAQPPSSKLRLLCSYGGHILPRPHDKSLSYVGGDTRIIVVDRSVTLADFLSRLSKTLLNGNNMFAVKYQLPNEELDSLITISTDEDLDNMIDEYDRLVSTSNGAKPGRIRLFLFESKPGSVDSLGSVQGEEWFLNALNGSSGGLASVNSLLGLDDSGKKLGKVDVVNQEAHSVPDSPIVGTTSSFGSTSSSPSLVNLAPIRVHVEEGGGWGGGVRVLDQRAVRIEEQFGQLGIGGGGGGGGGGVVEEGFGVHTQPGPVLMAGAGGEGSGRVYLDDDGYRKQQTMGMGAEVGVGMRHGVGVMPTQAQLKQMSGGEMPSPDSVSSDSSLSNAINRPKPVYQNPAAQSSSESNRISPNLMDPNTHIQMQQVSDTNYALPPQFEQHQHQHHHQQQLGQTQPLPQSQQYIPAGAHFVHHPPAGAIPLSTYYQMYPPQQPHHPHPHPHHPQYPLFYVPAGQSQAYSLPVQQPNISETANVVPSSHPQAPPNPAIITTSSAYNQAMNAPKPQPQLVQVPSSQNPPQAQTQPQIQPQQQQRYMGYSQIHHPSQSVVPSSTANASYGYEFADPGHAQVYYTQPLPPNIASQYQVTNVGTTMVVQEGSSQPGSGNLNQQIRSSQPL